mgnify:FL=1
MASPTKTNNSSTLAKRPVKDVYAVSRLVRESRAVLEGAFPLLWVEGEISNLAMPASGHIYFTLKDEIAQVRCAMFKGRNRQLRFIPENGLHVLLRVKVTLYEGRGEFQLVVEHMEEAGSGALQRAYEALKHRLGEAGLFDDIHKKPLPSIPETIGVISSADGAAVHDILTVLNRRFPASKVILYPVAVQGSDAARQITDAITVASQRQECDVLIVGRGGGSLEDLWSFNEESVAQAIFSCSIPIISAVGHEVDFTIADFVADVRAATPSAAAELSVPDAQQYLHKVQSHNRRMTMLISHYIQTEQSQLRQLQKRLPRPGNMIRQQMQYLDSLERRQQRAWQHIMVQQQQNLDHWSVRLKHPQSKLDAQKYRLIALHDRFQQIVNRQQNRYQQQLSKLSQRIQAQSPLPLVEQQKIRFGALQGQLHKSIRQLLQKNRLNIKQQIRTLSAVSPLNTLERGYSITTDQETGKVLRYAGEVDVGQHISIRLQQGYLHCLVQETKND